MGELDFATIIVGNVFWRVKVNENAIRTAVFVSLLLTDGVGVVRYFQIKQKVMIRTSKSSSKNRKLPVVERRMREITEFLFELRTDLIEAATDGERSLKLPGYRKFLLYL